MKKNLLSVMVVMAVSSLTLSCSSSEKVEGDLVEPKEVVNLVADPQPIMLTEEQQVFANDNNQFTLNYLKTVSETDRSGKGFVYSPLSITYVLGMVNDAATGQTEKELEQTLGFHEGGIKAVNEYCKKLIEGLPNVDNKVTLDMANAIFLNKDYTLKQQFQQDMQTYYDASAEALDFSSPKTLAHINSWCNDKTKGMIPKILDDVKPYMMSYLLNAIYFKADWTSKFDEKNTKTETFTTESGNTTMPLMHQNVLINYLKNDIYSVVEIPYGNGMWSMMVMLPEAGKTTDDVISLLAQRGLCVKTYSGGGGEMLRPYEVDLKLPRFETSSDTDELPVENGLVGLMQKMGIKLAFDSDFAEILNMCEVPVYIAMMRQKAKIKVNEKGSEAAAVTVAGMNKCTSASPEYYPRATFHANRPFVYAIQERSSGIILFVGKFTGK